MNSNNGLFSDSVLYCTALYLASENGHKEAVEFISELPIPTKGIDTFQFTAFFLAAKNGNLEVLRYFARSDVKLMDELTSCSADNANDNTFAKEETNLKRKLKANVGGVAAKQNCIDFIRPLELASGSVDDVNTNTCSKGQASCKRKLEVDEQEVVANPECADIFEAAKKGKMDELRVFVRNDQDRFMFANDENENTALHIAIENGHYDAAMFLLNEGGCIGLGNKEADTVIHLAAKNGALELLKEFLDHPEVFDSYVTVDDTNNDGNAAIHLACIGGYLELVELLVTNQADVNLQNYAGNSPLHFAVKNGSENLVKYLLKSGADINAINRNEEIVLVLANNDDLINLLIEKGAECEYENNWDNISTALHKAAEINNPTLVQNLLNRGFDVDSMNVNNGLTPLMYAAEKGNCKVIEILLRNGPNINAQSVIFKHTALHFAAKNRYFEAAQILLQNAPEVDVLDWQNQTPLIFAASNGHVKLVQLLLLHGANKNLRGKDNESALDRATRYKHEEIVRLLK